MRPAPVRIPFTQLRRIDRSSRQFLKAMGVLAKTDPATVNRPNTEEFPTPSRKRARRGPHTSDRSRVNLAHEDSAEQIQSTSIEAFAIS
jgi:hypothetical protein